MINRKTYNRYMLLLSFYDLSNIICFTFGQSERRQVTSVREEFLTESISFLTFSNVNSNVIKTSH